MPAINRPTSPSPHRIPARGRRRRAGTRVAACAACVAIIATAVSAAGPAVVASPPNSGAPCPRWTAVMVPGTTETTPAADPSRPTGMLRPIGDGLAARYGGDIAVRYLPYSAAPMPYRASESDGVNTLSTTLGRLCPTTRVALVGYSQGADIAGTVATKIGNGAGPIPASRVAAVGLLADPHRHPGTPQLGHPVGGQGIAGPRDRDFGALTGRVRTVCVAGDLYCSISPQAAPALTAVGRAFTGNPTLPETTPPNAPDAPGAASPGATGSLNPATVTRQVIIVLGGLAGFAANIPTIVDDITQLPAHVASGNIGELHRLSGDLNNQFRPLVRMAAQADLHLVAQALSMAAPLDTSGWTAVAAQIVGVLANLDINRVATDIGAIQEIAWRAAERLAVNDPLDAALVLTGLVPVAADLAAAAANALTGDIGNQLTATANTFTATTDPQTSTALTDLARQGGDAARFLTSGIHQNGYNNGVRDVLGWVASQIDRAR